MGLPDARPVDFASQGVMGTVTLTVSSLGGLLLAPNNLLTQEEVQLNATYTR